MHGNNERRFAANADAEALTTGGRTRLAEVGVRVDAFRALSTRGFSDEDYRTAVTVLERMAFNLEETA
ncbi:hypothetical protein OG625_18365 [Streptomyces sp. NBC_01351]|uniref:hypothetical protein n=1 Tax=Streptomyces sp. NBC_01351 TaxID=2903833 RepID=UPI002E2EFADC|nr:hypothetical protein [Streptomyces sp. NBC_01351]